MVVSAGLHRVLALARDLAQELVLLREDARQAGRTDTLERIDLELSGYPAGRTVPRYRHVAAQHRGDMHASHLQQDVPLPAAHLTFGDKAVVSEGLLHLRDMAGFLHALESGHDVLRRPVDPQRLPLYARGLPPGSGIRILAGWECIHADSLAGMLGAIRAYVGAMRS